MLPHSPKSILNLALLSIMLITPTQSTPLFGYLPGLGRGVSAMADIAVYLFKKDCNPEAADLAATTLLAASAYCGYLRGQKGVEKGLLTLEIATAVAAVIVSGISAENKKPKTFLDWLFS